VTDPFGGIQFTDGISIVFQDHVYTLDDLASHLGHVNRIWDAAHDLAMMRALLLGENVPNETAVLQELSDNRGIVDTPSPRVTYLNMSSPMTLLLALPTVAASGTVGWYACHLIKRALENPQKIGEWLPVLVASWRRGWLEADRVKLERSLLTIAIDEHTHGMDIALAKMLMSSGSVRAEMVQLGEVDPTVPGDLVDSPGAYVM
jgi:hypothetical protein